MDVKGLLEIVETWPITCALTSSAVIALCAGLSIKCLWRKSINSKKSKSDKKKRLPDKKAKSEQTESTLPSKPSSPSTTRTKFNQKPISQNRTTILAHSPSQTSVNYLRKTVQSEPDDSKSSTEVADSEWITVGKKEAKKVLNRPAKKVNDASHNATTHEPNYKNNPVVKERNSLKMGDHVKASHNNEPANDEESEWQEVRFTRKGGKHKKA